MCADNLPLPSVSEMKGMDEAGRAECREAAAKRAALQECKNQLKKALDIVKASQSAHSAHPWTVASYWALALLHCPIT